MEKVGDVDEFIEENLSIPFDYKTRKLRKQVVLMSWLGTWTCNEG